MCSVKSDKWIVFSSNTGYIGVGWWLLECTKMVCQVLNKRGYGLVSCLQQKVNALHLMLQCAPSTLNCITAFLSLLQRIPRYCVLSFWSFPRQNSVFPCLPHPSSVAWFHCFGNSSWSLNIRKSLVKNKRIEVKVAPSVCIGCYPVWISDGTPSVVT